MVLSDQQILKTAQSGVGIEIDPFEKKQVQPASYDLRVGAQGITTSGKEVVDLKQRGFLVLEPGDFGVVITHEMISLDVNHTARIGLRSGLSRKGLIATTGPQIDPGFKGRLIVGLTNLTPNPVSLTFKDDFITVEFHRLDEPCKNPYNGPFQGQEGLRPSDIALVAEQKGMALSEMMGMLGSLSKNVHTLATEVKSLKWIFGLGLAALGVLIAVFSFPRTICAMCAGLVSDSPMSIKQKSLGVWTSTSRMMALTAMRRMLTSAWMRRMCFCRVLALLR